MKICFKTQIYLPFIDILLDFMCLCRHFDRIPTLKATSRSPVRPGIYRLFFYRPDVGIQLPGKLGLTAFKITVAQEVETRGMVHLREMGKFVADYIFLILLGDSPRRSAASMA